MAVDAVRRGPGLRLVQYLLVLVAETAWIYPWTIALEFWFGQKMGPFLSFQVVLAVITAAMLATRLATHVPRSRGPSPSRLGPFPLPARPVRFAMAYSARVAVLGLGLLIAGRLGLEQLPAFADGAPWDEVWRQYTSTDFAVRATQVTILAVLLWWRGIHLGRARPTLSRVEDQFVTGIVALAALLAVAAMAGKVTPFPQDSLILSTLALLSATLVGMPLARIVDVEERPRYAGGQPLAPGGCWLAMLSGTVGGLLLFTLLIAQLFSFNRIAEVWAAISEPLGAVFMAVIYVLALPVGLLVQLLIFLANLLMRPETRQPKATSDSDFLDKLGQGDPLNPSPELIFVLKALLIAAVTIVLLWLLLRAISRLGDRALPDGVEEKRDSVWKWPGLLWLWRWFLARWRPLVTRVSAVGARGPAQGQSLGAMRDLYRQFLALGAALGHARRPAETPLEYERRLAREPDLPGAEEVRSLTEGYNRVRYAPPAIAPDNSGLFASALARLRTLWQRG